MQLALVVALLGVGPVLDPLEGSVVTTEERWFLPSGRTLGEVADLWFVEIVNMQNADGGIAAFDPLYVSSHGRSWTQLRHTLNTLSIVDPARSGLPIIELPYGVWDRLHYQSLWTAEPGFHASVPTAAAQPGWVRVGAGRDVGGGIWIPSGFMDREPALSYGATPDRRALRRAGEIEAVTGMSGAAGSFRLAVEHLDHSHRFPTLLDSATGLHLPDDAARTTVLGSGRTQVGSWPLEAVLAWQGRQRSREGAQFRLPAPYTRDVSANALLAQVGTEMAEARYRFEAALGWRWRRDDERSNTESPIVSDLEREWTWLARPSFGERLERMSIEGRAALHWESAVPVSLSLTGSQGFVSSTQSVPGGLTGLTYERGGLAGGAPRAVSITVYEPAARAEESLQSARLQLDAAHTMGPVRLSFAGGADYAAVGVPGDTRLWFLSPAAGVAARMRLGGGELFTLVRREPDALTSGVAAFLDPARANGERYTWLDDGDGVPESGETGELLARTGGRYHLAGEDLARPSSNQFVIGWRSPSFGPFQAVLTGIARWHLDALTVRMAGPAAESYAPVSFHDPGGDGRGEERLPEGGQLLTVYERAPGTEGAELYALVNRERDNRYIGAEIQLVSVEERRWFMNLGGAGYWNIGSGSFGSFPDRNDPGVVDETTADPNARVNQRGRFDQDRSFAVNLLTGVRPLDELSLSTAIRYRDGQPFTRIVVAELPQGPTPIMAVWRGAPRHTFHMVVDARARYDIALAGFDAAVVLDAFNLLGSGVELLEQPRTRGEFRRSLEMVPGRALFVSLELAAQ